MFCTNCGKKISESVIFCTECGKSTSSETEVEASQVDLESKWWFRLVKVVYIGLYVTLPFFLITWIDENSSYREDAFWLTIITFIIYIVSMKLIRIIFLYVAFAQKPRWKKEFKKIF